MGDAPSAPAPHVGGGEEVNPNPSIGGCCSDSVSVELSMGGDYYHACCGDADLDLHAPEGPKASYVGDKEPLSTLAAEFQSGSPILQEKIKGNEKQKSTVGSNVKASKVKKEETDSDDDCKPKLKKSGTVSTAKTSKVKKIKDEDLEDDTMEQKKRKKKVGIKEDEKKAAGKEDSEKGKKERKVYELPGQKHDPPAERDPLKIFYESLYEQVPTSEMAATWPQLNGWLLKMVTEILARVNATGTDVPQV